MKTVNKFYTAASVAIAGTAATLGLGGIAQAAQLNANLGFTPIGSDISFTGATLGSATSITFAATNVVNTIPPQYTPPGGSTAPNDFAAGGLAPVALLSAVTLSPNPLDLTSPIPFTVNFTAGGNPATFTATAFLRSSSASNNLNLLFNGTITGTGFDDTEGSLSFAFTQVAGGVINYSATLAAPPSELVCIPGTPGCRPCEPGDDNPQCSTPDVPEPSAFPALAILASLGFLKGLGKKA